MSVPGQNWEWNSGAAAAALLVFVFGGAACAQTTESPASHMHTAIGAAELDAELTRVAREIVAVSDGKPNLSQLYLIMHDACQTALGKVGPPPSGPIPALVHSQYCTCDATLTIDDWLKNPQMKQSLLDFNAAPNEQGARTILANHKIHEHDPVCGAAFRGAN